VSGRPHGARRASGRSAPASAAGYWLGGRRPVLAALRSGRARRVAVAEGAHGLDELLAAAAAARVQVSRLPRQEVDRLAGSPAHGCAAEVRPAVAVALDALIARCAGEPRALLVACDHIQDPHNLGAIARTADAAGAAGLILPERRAAGITAAAERTSAGALGALPCATVHNLAWAIEQCRRAGFWCYGAAPDGEVDYTRADFAARSVLVVGSEGAGLGRVVRRSCDRIVRLPMWGAVESLNAAVAAGILMYEWARGSGGPTPPGRDGHGAAAH
jgi:23S rRNA (guanosine2251-2'-O)-methyltransferase